jgi:aminoglycoside phosphotransferase family enzyme
MSAWPSLSGDRGYKLKKPVTTDLVDLVDLVVRAGGWRRAGGEVELNRRLAVDVYLEISSITDA